MSLYRNKKSACVIFQKVSKSSFLTSKSVTTYCKELKENEEPKETEILGVSEHSTTAGTDSSEERRKSGLENVLSALRNSSKGNIPYSLTPEEDEIDEICDLKNVGDLSRISFSEENSFREVLTEEEDEDVDKEDSRSSVGDSPLFEETRFSMRDISIETDKQYDEVDSLCHTLKAEILLGQLRLEEERLQKMQLRRVMQQKSYFENVYAIRSHKIQNLLEVKKKLNHSHNEKQMKLEQQHSLAAEESEQLGKKYLMKVEAEKQEIVKEIDAVKADEEKRLAEFTKLIQSLSEPMELFRKNLGIVQSNAENVPEDSDLRKILFEALPHILESTEQSLRKMDPANVTEREIATITERSTDGISILEHIQRLLDQNEINIGAAKEEVSPQDQSTASVNSTLDHQQQPPVIDNQTPSGVPVVAPPPPQVTHEVPVVAPPPQVTHEVPVVAPPQVTHEKLQQSLAPQLVPPIPSSQSAHDPLNDRFVSLKSKFNQVTAEAEVAKNNVSLRPLLSRSVGIINTLSNSKHDSSNRGKLQQILNLLGGRSCTIGSDTFSTKNNPSALAFVKEQLSSRIVILAHDRQVASMAVYASLIVRLWQLYPDMGDLILFKLYETCPFLVPIKIKERESNQTEADFYRSLGFRQKDGGPQEAVDKYLTRMGSAAQLYGRIVSMQVDNHPHGISEGWLWLARTLQSPPYPSVTASLLNGFLSTAGSCLLSSYGRQFRKLLHYLSTNYILQIEKDVIEGGHSDNVKLKTFISTYEQTNTIPPTPEGYKLLL